MKVMCLHRTLFLQFLLLSFFVFSCIAFNLDSHSPILFTRKNASQDSTFFGFSHALYSENDQSWLIVGAPRTSGNRESERYAGRIYKCRVTDGINIRNACSPLQLYVNDTRITMNDKNVASYTSYNFSQWLGVAMDTSFSVNGGKFVGCAHLQANVIPLDSDCQNPRGSGTNGTGVLCYRTSGICYSLENLGSDNSRPKIVSRMPSYTELVNNLPVPDEDNKTPGVYHYAFAQWGTSVRLSKEKDYVIMGAPGSFHWRGNVIVQMNHISCALEKIETFRSYFGYSITDVTLASRPDELIIAGGAPRGSEKGEKGELGQVIIISLRTTGMTDEKCRNDPVTVLQRISFINESVYNYFGGSILAVDVNGDNDDELFVGAPFTNLNMSGGEGDEGAVYCYTYNSTGLGLFEMTALLHGATKTRESRFGTAIASMGDMNLDGFNDIVIGAPHEDGESGAVYIYLGSRFGITPTTPHQRIAASDVASRLPLKAFGYSLGTGRDIDGNAYPDLSVGAFLSDSVAVFRTRPVHDVTAKIWFPAPDIRWQQLNCSKSGDKQEFRTSVYISFFYNVPRKERYNTAPVFVLSDYLGRNATLDASSGKIVFEDVSAPALQLLAVPCLPNALLQANNCVSFKSFERPNSYLRLIDDVAHLATYDGNDGSYNQSASFRIEGGNLLDHEKLQRLSSVSVGILNKPSLYLQSTGGRELKALSSGDSMPRSDGDSVPKFDRDSMPREAVFTFTADYHLLCIQDLVYDLHIDHGIGHNERRALLTGPNQDTQLAATVKETISFTSRNLFEPLNRTWTVVFPKYPRNIGLPLTFQVTLTGPTFKANVAARDSKDVIDLSRLSPLLNSLAKIQFDGEIGFFKECGNDSRCDAVLDTTLTVISVGGGLIIGSTVDLNTSLTIFNSGEAAISVRLEIVHPSLVVYKLLTLEDACNEVTGISDSFDASSAPESDNLTSQADDGRAAVYFDVKNQIHTNESLVFVASFSTKKVKTENDFPEDEMEFLIRTGTQGSIETGTNYTSFRIPVRYEGKLETQGNSEPSMLEFSNDPDSLTELGFEHLYIVSNVGPGLIPSIIIDVLVPQETRYNIVKSMSVQVNESDSMEKRRLENGTDIKMENLHNEVENQEELDLPSNKETGVIQAVVQLVQGNSQGRTIHMDCKEGRCSSIRRYHFGSMYAGEDVFVKIKITISVTNMTKIEDLDTFTFSSYVRARPENISVNVKQWRAGQVNTTFSTTKVITVLQNKMTATIPVWVYIVSTLVGLLHLVAIFLIMWKCGFFKRKYSQLKENAVRESKLPTKSDHYQENDDQDSQYDNEMLLDDQPHRSGSQHSVASSNNIAMEEGSLRIISPAVDELHAKHPGIDFTAE